MNTLFDSQASWFTVPAIVATFFFLLKLVLMMVGGGLDMDMDGGGADFGGDVGGDFDIDAGSAKLESDAALKVLSLQVVAAAIMGFGWGGFSALKGFGMDIPQSVFVGLLVGVAFGWVQIWLMRVLYSLGESGNISIRDTLGREAEVCLTVPASKEGRGRVRVTINDRQRIFNAVTEDEEPLPTKRQVRIVRTNDDNSVTVEAV